MKATYYALFTKEKGTDGYNVAFPDIFGGVTCGDNFDDALEMAKDLLLTMLKNAPGQCYKPSSKDKLEKLFPEAQIVEVEVELTNPKKDIDWEAVDEESKRCLKICMEMDELDNNK